MLMQQSMSAGNFAEYHLLTQLCLHGIRKMWEHENHADNMHMRQADELQWMMSQTSHAK